MSKKTIAVGMSPPHPGAFIRDEVLTPLALSIAAAAEILDVRRATLSDLVNFLYHDCCGGAGLKLKSRG